MSLPAWAKRPLKGAMKPMRIGSAAGAGVAAASEKRAAAIWTMKSRERAVMRAPPISCCCLLPAEVHRAPTRLRRGSQARSHLVAPRLIAHCVEDLRLPPEAIGGRPCSEPPRLLVVRIPGHADGHTGFPGPGLAMRGEDLVALAETDQVRGAPSRASREQQDRESHPSRHQKNQSRGPATHFQ